MTYMPHIENSVPITQSPPKKMMSERTGCAAASASSCFGIRFPLGGFHYGT